MNECFEIFRLLSRKIMLLQNTVFPLIILVIFITLLCEINSLYRINTHHHNKHSFHPRVLQGWPDVNDEYPYVVALADNYGVKVCTASFISKQWVLTAAHCVKPKIKYIICGNMSIPRNETKCKSKVLKMIAHPAYILNSIKVKHDIALARVEEIVIKTFGRIHSADYKTFLGRSVRFAGYGQSIPSYTYSSIGKYEAFALDQKTPLQIGEGGIFFKESEEGVITVVPKCTNTRHGPYFGDSGGPLFVDKKIVAVLSRGDDGHEESKTFFNPKHPEINFYTPVSPYQNWIRITMLNG